MQRPPRYDAPAAAHEHLVTADRVATAALQRLRRLQECCDDPPATRPDLVSRIETLAFDLKTIQIHLRQADLTTATPSGSVLDFT